MTPRKRVLWIGTLTAGLLLAGCDQLAMPVEEDNSYEQAQAANEQSARNLVRNDVLPVLDESLERENIKRRIEFINQSDRVGYLYLLTSNGQLIKEVHVQGKVSSLNSYLTPMEDVQLVKHKGDSSYSMETPVTTEAADLDGTWGENAGGIFWFTPEGVYQEWSGQFFYSSERMSFETKPILMEVGNDQ